MKGARKMKYKIINIYDDFKTLIEENTYLLADARFNDLMEFAQDLDLIIAEDFGERELFVKLLKHDDDEIFIYDLPRIYRSIYAMFLANYNKYMSLMSALDLFENYDPDADYFEQKTWGEKEKTNQYGAISKSDVHGARSESDVHGARSESDVHGAQSVTKTYGNINKTINTGAATDSTTNGARENTNAVVPSFSDSFSNKDKTSQAQAIDSTTYGARSDSEQTTHANDSESKTGFTDSHTAQAFTDSHTAQAFTDSHTQNARTDKQTETQTIDTKSGYNNRISQIENITNYAKRIDFVRTIAADIANQITYNYYI